MADLKTTIAQTENLKNKVKLAKDRINETVVRGGGITSKSLSEIPDNIKSMISKNYKKIAMGSCSIEKVLKVGGEFLEVPIATDFKPSRVIVSTMADTTLNLILDTKQRKHTFVVSSAKEVDVSYIDNKVIIKLTKDPYSSFLRVNAKEWLAIG